MALHLSETHISFPFSFCLSLIQQIIILLFKSCVTRKYTTKEIKSFPVSGTASREGFPVDLGPMLEACMHCTNCMFRKLLKFGGTDFYTVRPTDASSFSIWLTLWITDWLMRIKMLTIPQATVQLQLSGFPSCRVSCLQLVQNVCATFSSLPPPPPPPRQLP